MTTETVTNAATTMQTSKVEIYTTRYCGYCRSAKALLDRKGIPYTEIDVSSDPGGRQAMDPHVSSLFIPRTRLF